MKFRNLAVNCLIIFTIVANSLAAHGAGSDGGTYGNYNALPGIEGVDLNVIPTLTEGSPRVLPPQVEKIFEEKAKEAAKAPSWVKRLQQRTVKSYFPKLWPVDKPMPLKNSESLIVDTINLHNFYEKGNPQTKKHFKGFIDDHLKPFIKSLTLSQMKKSVVANWTVEQMLVIKQLTYLSKYPNYFKRSMELVTGPHLRGASITAAKIAIVAGIFYGLYKVGAGEAFKHGFYNGVMGALVGSALGWFIGPTSEAIKKHAARIFAKPEIWVGRGADKITNWFFGGNNKEVKAGEEAKVEGPKLATIETDGMDFAMTAKDQKQNWQKVTDMWVEVAKTFGQLLRDTLHSGRVLMQLQWNDERDTTLSVETIRNGLMLLDLKADTLLSPYFSVALLQGGREQLEKLRVTHEEYKKLYNELMDSAELTEEQVHEIKRKLLVVRKQLYELGVSSMDIETFDQLQIERARSLGKLITALTTNELRSFFMAEANRNLVDSARIAQRAVRRGYGNQEFVDIYRGHIQTMQRNMGFENTAPVEPPVHKTTNPFLKRIESVTELSCRQLFL